MLKDDEEIKPEEFSNLILDDISIPKITEADKTYLDTFINVQRLSMNACNLKSLDNLPNGMPIVRVSELLHHFVFTKTNNILLFIAGVER